MRVLHINSVVGHSSTGKIISDIHHELMNQGNDSFVLYGRESAFGQTATRAEESNIKLITSQVEIAQHVLLGVFLDKHGLYSKRATERFIDEIINYQPDIIHLHNLHGFYINYEILFRFLKEFDKPIIWTLHDCWSFTGFCSHYEYNQCEQWKSGCTQCPFRDVYPYRILSRSAKNFEIKEMLFTSLKKLTLVAPSFWLKEQLSESFLAKQDIRVIHNDIDLSKFKYIANNDLRNRYNLLNKQIILAVSGMWNKQKGLNEYYKMAAKLSVNQCLVMIGLSEKQIKKCPKTILALPKTNSFEELVAWYSISDVFVNLTLEDTYPTVNLEAKACGLPIITYRTGGSTEMITDSDYIADKYNIDQVLNLINNVTGKHQMVLKEANMIASYLNLYKEKLQ